MGAYLNFLSVELKSSLNRNMDEVSEICAQNFRTNISSLFKSLNSISAIIDRDVLNDLPSLIIQFENFLDYTDFDRIGIILPNGDGYGVDYNLGVLPVKNYSDRTCFTKGLEGKKYISDILEDVWTGNNSVALSIPIFDSDNKTVIGVLIGALNVESLSDILDMKIFNGDGYVNVFDSDGNIILRSARSDNTSKKENIFDENYVETEGFDKLRENLKVGLGGNLSFKQPGKKTKYVVYTPIGVSDWNVGVVLPASLVGQKSKEIMIISSFLSVFIVLLVIIMMILIVRVREYGQRRLLNIALTDPLTKLSNANCFVEELKCEKSYFKGKHALIIYNVRNFSFLNSFLGYEKGNNIICQLGSIFEQNKQRNEFIAHVQGDRFVLLFKYDNKDEIVKRMKSILDEICQSIDLGNMHGQLVSQCCILPLTENELAYNPNILIQDLQVALSFIEERSKDSIIFYNSQFNERRHYLDKLNAIMPVALEDGEFIPYFQPQYDISGDKPILCGAELLSRWNSPEMGIIYPDVFIPLSEKSGFIIKLDMYMISKACEYVKELLLKGIQMVPISVNISRLHFYQDDFIEEFTSLVDSYGIDHDLIELEVTESLAFDNHQLLWDRVNAIRAAGFRIAMDDFGSGYSSLTLLKDIPLDIIKMDKSFFGKTLDTDQGREMIRSVVCILKNMKFKIIAEGITTEEEVNFLKECGCNIIQGFYFSKPVLIDVFIDEHLNKSQNKD